MEYYVFGFRLLSTDKSVSISKYRVNYDGEEEYIDDVFVDIVNKYYNKSKHQSDVLSAVIDNSSSNQIDIRVTFNITIKDEIDEFNRFIKETINTFYTNEANIPAKPDYDIIRDEYNSTVNTFYGGKDGWSLDLRLKSIKEDTKEEKNENTVDGNNNQTSAISNDEKDFDPSDLINPYDDVDDEFIEQEDSRSSTDEDNKSTNDTSNSSTNNPPCIISIESPTIKLEPIKIQSNLSDKGNKEIAKGVGYLPFVWYNGYQISERDIKSLTLYHDGILPKVKFTFQDSNGLMRSIGFPQDDTTFQLFLNSRSPNLKSIHLDFKVQNFQDGGKGKYTIIGTLNVPGLYYLEFKSYKQKTSLETLKEIAKECGLGFNSNIDNTDDKMTWINPGNRVYEFIQDIIKNSYKSDESFLHGYIDYYYSFNYVDIEKELNRDITQDVIVDTSGSKEQLVSDDNKKLIPLRLTNDQTSKSSSLFFENFKLKNNSTMISLEEGYMTKVKFYDCNKKDLLIFDIDSITSEGDKTIILKGKSQEKDFYENHYNSIWNGKLDIDNAHKNFNYSFIQNDRNIADLVKISVDFQMPNPNFNLYKLQKVNMVFNNTSKTPSNPEALMWRLTGEWLIVNIEFNFKNGTIVQNITAIKRELSMSPSEIKNQTPQESRNKSENNSNNDNPDDLTGTDAEENSNNNDSNNDSNNNPNNTSNTENEPPTEFDLDYVVGPDGGKLSHGLMDNNKKVPVLAVVDGQPVEEKTAIAFMKMKTIAEKEGVKIAVNSGFRPAFGANLKGKTSKGKTITITTQESLRRDKSRWKKNAYNAKDDDDFTFNAPASAYNPATAAPGKSNHGSGIALDLSTGSRISFSKVLRNNAYEWLVKNSWKYGFVRAVNSEEWHFEYLPNIASKGPYAKVPKSGNVSGDANNLFYSDLGLNNLCAC
jgi:LAS superfamily LD-carboxypeptidase LdcB